MKITVTEEHLNQAILALPWMPLCSSCLMAQAIREHLPEMECALGFVFHPSDDETMLWDYRNTLGRRAESLFDEREFHTLRKILPFEIELTPIQP